MIPNSLLAQAHTLRHDDRLSDDLRTYLRLEWNGDPSPLRPRGARPRPRRWTLERRLLRGRVAARDSGPASPERARGAQTEPAKAARSMPVADCEHAQTEYLGASRFTEFLRCLLCGDLFILQPGHTWRLRPRVARSAGSGAP
jgi:hypothetical protein